MSVLLVLCLALDRWFAVVRPIQYRYNFTTRRVVVYLAIILIYAVSFSIPNILLLHGKTLNYVKTIDIVLILLIPIPATWIMFVQIWFHARTSLAVQNTAGGKMKSKLLRMYAVTSILLTVSWLPTQLDRFLSLLAVKDETLIIPTMIAMSNSFINPWVYCFTNKEYKKEFEKILPCISAVQCRCTSNERSSGITDCSKNVIDSILYKNEGAVSTLSFKNLNES